MKRQPLDPVAAANKFAADMEAMNKDKPKADGPARQRMLAKSFGLAEHKFRRWSAELTEAQTLEQALDPTFWADQVGLMSGHDKSKGRGDIIEVRKLDTGLYAELLVTEIGVGFVRVELIGSTEPKAVEIPAGAKMATRWNAGARTHEVIRKSDGQVMAQGFQTKAAAAAWIEKHMQAMAA